MKFPKWLSWLEPATAFELAQQEIDQAQAHVEELAKKAAHFRKLADTYAQGHAHVVKQIRSHKLDIPLAHDEIVVVDGSKVAVLKTEGAKVTSLKAAGRTKVRK